MDGVKRLINFILPVKACNFKCHYCYVGQENRFDGEIGSLEYPPEHIQRALTLQRLGGVCHINMCGLGETLLAPYVVELARRMLENGHVVSVVTNGTIKSRIDELCALPVELKKRLFFKISYHYLELVRLNQLDAFFENVKKIRNCGCAFSVELTVNDESIEKISILKKLCEENLGAACHIIESRNNLDGYSRLSSLEPDEHQSAWGEMHSPLFDFQQTQWMIKRKEFCYAGDWVVNLYAASGWMTPCFAGGNLIQNLFIHPEEPIHFFAIGEHCPWTHCYAAYVLMSSGVIPELDTPCYAEFRERTCSDGSNWLTPYIKEFFSTRLAQSNEQYSVLKKRYINALMQQEYPETECQLDIKLGKDLADYLITKEISSIGLWGNSDKSTWLTELLMHTPVRVKFIVDIQFQEKSVDICKNRFKHRVKYWIKRILNRCKQPILLNKYDALPKVDIIVSLHNEHAFAIPKKTGCKIYVLTELAD